MLIQQCESAFQAKADDPRDADPSLRAAAMVLIAYAREHPARYRLLFSDPELVSAGGTMEVAAWGASQAFLAIVRRCQAAGSLRPMETARLTGLIYATLHGAIDLELGGRAREAKGLGSIEATVDLLLDLLSPRDRATAPPRKSPFKGEARPGSHPAIAGGTNMLRK